MEKTKKLWIVSEVFYPDETSSGYYLTEIAKHLAQFQEVNVICSATPQDKQSKLTTQSQSLPPNINLYQVKTLALDKNKLFFRVLRLLNLTIAFSYQLFLNIKKGDSVWLVTNPAFLVPIAAFLARIKHFKLCILVHDLFPENLVPANLSNTNKITFKVIKYIFDKAYISVNLLAVCGRDMASLFEKKIGLNQKNKIKIIENWADVDIIYPTHVVKNDIYPVLGINDKIIFQFAGNIGRLQGLEILLDIIAECCNPILHFVIIGEGAFKNYLKTKAEMYKMTNVSFLNSFNRNEQNLFLNACDVGIVSLYDSMLGLGVPSKSYNIMAAGKPILFLGNKNSEIGMMVQEHNIGWQFEWSESEKIKLFFQTFSKESLINKNPRIVAENFYSKEVILSKYSALLEAM